MVVYGRRDAKLLRLDEQTEVESRDVFCLPGKFAATVSNTLCATLEVLKVETI